MSQDDVTMDLIPEMPVKPGKKYKEPVQQEQNPAISCCSRCHSPNVRPHDVEDASDGKVVHTHICTWCGKVGSPIAMTAREVVADLTNRKMPR